MVFLFLKIFFQLSSKAILSLPEKRMTVKKESLVTYSEIIMPNKGIRWKTYKIVKYFARLCRKIDALVHKLSGLNKKEMSIVKEGVR